MRTARGIATLSIVAGIFAPPAAAAQTAIVDAGVSRRVEAAHPFSLEATVEGGSVGSVDWLAPSGCLVEDPGVLITIASCASTGRATFAVQVATDGGEATDTVTLIVIRSYTATIDRGGILTGVPDEPAGSGSVDGATQRIPFEVPEGAIGASVTLDWSTRAADLDLGLETPEGARWPDSVSATLLGKPEIATVDLPTAGTWWALVQPKAAVETAWTLRAEVEVIEGDVPFPTLELSRASGVPGETVTIEAVASGGTPPLAITWEASPGSRAFDDAAGDGYTLTFQEATAVSAKVTDATGLETTSTAFVRLRGTMPERPYTVVGVIDDGFTPYHWDFVGHRHPWNLDADPFNDLDLTVDPATYIEGYPGGGPLYVTVPTEPDEIVEVRPSEIDSAVWRGLEQSSLATGVHLYWFPGTKIIGAVAFDRAWYGGNSAHGTRSAASAAGNLHGTCPECLFVLIKGFTTDALIWAASQPWIDVVNNSYGHCSSMCVVRDGVYLGAPTAATLAGTLRGATIVFSAGNGIANQWDVPQLTYTSSEQGPDWIVTVGGNAPDTDQNYLGSGKPVDISAVGSDYPSTGGVTAAGSGTHAGTSNAGPVVAGTFAKVLQEARAALGDTSPGHAGGIVATGEPVPCGDAAPDCALGDGILTRAELWRLVFDNVLPAPMKPPSGGQIPTTAFAYYYQGYGALLGRLRGTHAWRAEWEPMIDNARGTVASPLRPPGEGNWFVVDSKCRQRLWGPWDQGAYTGVDPVLDPVADPLASAFDVWCSTLPSRTSLQR